MKTYELTKLEKYIEAHPHDSWETIAIAMKCTPGRAQEAADSALIKQAKALALRDINRNRAADKLPPLIKVERLWWSIYGNEYRERVLSGPEDADCSPAGAC